MSKRSSDGSTLAGGLIFLAIVAIPALPKPLSVVIGILAAIAFITWILYRISLAVDRHQAAELERAREEQARKAAENERRSGATRHAREERARRVKQLRTESLGKKNLALVDAALKAVKQVRSTEAARDGWLGDVDFNPDIRDITDKFKKAQSLRRLTEKLSALDEPTAEDREILAEAKATIATLERTATERVKLIEKCAKEAQLIDTSLRVEREKTHVAEQWAELHGELSALLFIESVPNPAAGDTGADAVIARVQAYREIKNQIELIRGAETI
ncbi:hypothetical protein MPNTM1_00394 [Mycolicibacterium parafortuitum]|uniref:hypothetical protein n=1 Tax=Mycolicibacterium parafortuitum TaxID=39692 RepID=UPI0032C3DFC7